MKDSTQSGKSLSAKAVAVGASVFLSGLVLVFVAGVLFGSTAAYRAAQAGADEQQIAEQVARRLAGPTYGLTALAIASVFTLLGGWAAARLAGAAPFRHALPVGLLSLFAGILLLLLAPFAVPVLMLAAVLASPVPLALAGGYLGGRAWRPLLAETEDEMGDEEGAAGTADDAALTRWTARRTRGEEQHTRVVGRLVEQRREQESEWQRERDAAARRRELERAVEQSKSEACDDMRAVVREAFLSHPAATEEDFERCWPELRDEVFREHALRAYAGRTERVNSES